MAGGEKRCSDINGRKSAGEICREAQNVRKRMFSFFFTREYTLLRVDYMAGSAEPQNKTDVTLDIDIICSVVTVRCETRQKQKLEKKEAQISKQRQIAKYDKNLKYLEGLGNKERKFCTKIVT